MEYVTNHYNKRGGVDMLFVIADDVADEDIFKVYDDVTSVYDDVTYVSTYGHALCNRRRCR